MAREHSSGLAVTVTKENGQGTLTSRDGSQWRGDWRDNKPWNMIEFDNEQHIIGMWLNGIEE